VETLVAGNSMQLCCCQIVTLYLNKNSNA